MSEPPKQAPAPDQSSPILNPLLSAPEGGEPESLPVKRSEEAILLELDTMDALRGADDVRKRLLLEMSTGTPSISDLAYALKVRVKEDFKVVEKVERKRKTGKSDYQVSTLRDLVGLRIVTLYRLDALEILPLLFERIISSAQEEDGLFSPRGIEEIIIYSTSPNGDAQDLPGRVKALCQAFGFVGHVNETPQKYTSIHIVVWCRGKYRNGYRDIPVEIQVRTAFEDVWGEIDHSLKYKRETAAEVMDDRAAGRLELNQAHLNVMKTLIDGLAQYGDQIKLQMEDDQRIRATTSRRSEQPIDKLEHLPGLDDGARQLARLAVTSAQDTLSAAAGQGTLRVTRRRVAADLIRAVERVREMKLPAHEDELVYVLEMERALLLLEMGNDLPGASRNDALVEASRIYTHMAELFPDRIAPMYRLARTLDELGDKAAARKKFEEADAALPASDLGKDHWLRCAVPRLLAFSIWEEAAHQIVGGSDRAAPLVDILRAIDLSVTALKAAGEDETEISKTSNNLVYYLLDFRRYGGVNDELKQRGFDDDAIATMVNRLEANAADEAAHWDTIRAAYATLGNAEAALSAAKKVIELLNAPYRRERWSPNEAIMMRDSQQFVELFETT